MMSSTRVSMRTIPMLAALLGILLFVIVEFLIAIFLLIALVVRVMMPFRRMAFLALLIALMARLMMLSLLVIAGIRFMFLVLRAVLLEFAFVIRIVVERMDFLIFVFMEHIMVTGGFRALFMGFLFFEFPPFFAFFSFVMSAVLIGFVDC